MMAMPFLAIDNCKDEIRFYQRVFGGEVEILRKQGDEVLNADLHVEGTTIKFADTRAAKPVSKGDFVRAFLRIETEAAFRRIYGELAEGGTIVTEAYEAPFNGLLAVVTDRNGACWVLSFYRG